MRPPSILHDDTVTIVKVTTSTTPDADGLPAETTATHTWDGVNVQQVGTREWDNDRHTTVVRYRVAGPIPPVTISAADRISWRGEHYEIEGQPDVRTGPLRINHCALVMRRAIG